jgi:hypothetical protein
MKTKYNSYYVFFSGKNAIQGSALKRIAEITEEGMEPEDINSVGPVSVTNVKNYTVYVVPSTKKKSDKWCVISPFNEKMDDDCRDKIYDLCMKAIDKAKKSTKQITFSELINQ